MLSKLLSPSEEKIFFHLSQYKRILARKYAIYIPFYHYIGVLIPFLSNIGLKARKIKRDENIYL